MPMIAMTREMGSLGRDVAAGVAAVTNRRVVYHEIIEPIANKMRLRKSHVERFLDGKAGLWERLTTDRTSLSIFTADETFRFLRDGTTGVIRGWGAVHLLKPVRHVMRVRVCAPFETRVERMMQRLGTDDRRAVESEIQLSEEAHSAITRRHFGLNWRDPEHYDLVLCTERLSVSECVEAICGMLGRPSFQETAESLRLVDDLAVEWSVRAALRRDARTASTSFVVHCASGVVMLMGMVEKQEEVDAAISVASAVEGVVRVESGLRPTELALSHYRRA